LTPFFHAASGSRSGILELADLDYVRPENYGALSLDNLKVTGPKNAFKPKVPTLSELVLDAVEFFKG
jgi:hypothetical protein